MACCPFSSCYTNPLFSIWANIVMFSTKDPLQQFSASFDILGFTIGDNCLLVHHVVIAGAHKFRTLLHFWLKISNAFLYGNKWCFLFGFAYSALLLPTQSLYHTLWCFLFGHTSSVFLLSMQSFNWSLWSSLFGHTSPVFLLSMQSFNWSLWSSLFGRTSSVLLLSLQRVSWSLWCSLCDTVADPGVVCSNPPIA